MNYSPSQIGSSYGLPFANSRGQTLLQVLISVAIMSAMSVLFASQISNQLKTSHALTQKVAQMDLEKLLIASLADGSVCGYILNNPGVLTFNSTAVSAATPQTLTPTLPIYATVAPGPVLGPVVAQVGAVASPYSNDLIVSGITLSVTGAPAPMPAPGPNVTFTGNWTVTFNPAKLVVPLKPVTVATTLTVDTTSPTAAVVKKCQGGNSPSGGYKDVRAIRAVNTNYTNNAATTQFVTVSANVTPVFGGGAVGFATFDHITAVVDGQTIEDVQVFDGNGPGGVFPFYNALHFMVPPGSTYQIRPAIGGAGLTITKWFELN